MSGYVRKYIDTVQWAMLEEYLELIAAITERDAELQSDAAEAIERRFGSFVDGTREATVRGNVGILPVTGPLFRYANLFTAMSGATSFERLAIDFGALEEDPRVDKIIMEVNSPGGEVDGSAEMAELIRSASKPTVAYISHLGASAGLWIASAADQVYAAPTALVGSVGVVSRLRRVQPRAGVEELEIVSSMTPKKRMDAFAEDDEGRAARAEIQRRVDDMALVFIESVARYRGMDASAVMETEGGVFVGQRAVDVGFVDGITTLEGLIQSLQGSEQGSSGPVLFSAGLPGTDHSQEAEMEITRAYLEENHPDLVAAIREEGAAEARESGYQDGAAAERDRILGIMEIPAAGFEELQQELMADPAISRGEAALRILDAKGAQEERRKQAAKDDLVADEEGLEEVKVQTGEFTEEAEQDAAIADVLHHVKKYQTQTAAL